MSNEDVIELGSSDEETIEPAPKKRKPMPNAMVCIPSKLHEVTIQPAKSPAPKVFPGKPINNQNILNAKININNKNILKGKPVSTIKMKPRLACNPYAEQKRRIINQIKPCNSSVTFTKLPSQKCIIPKNQNKGVPQILKVPTQIQNVNKINLPSSITVKRTVASRPIVTLNVKNKKHVNPTRALSNEVLTVELDDDEVSAPCSNSPQWYIRPEDQQEVPICEEENNKEPDTAKFIEITIEDSPVKPSQNKITNQVRSTSAIVIEDSPVKAVADKTNIASGSENEDEGVSNEEPQSKKKLEYSRDIESNKTIEIEIDDLNEVSVSIENNENEKSEEKVPNKDQIQLNETSKEQITAETMNDKKTEVENNDLSEFHPIYQSFINLCFQLENSDDMQKIVEKKVKGYYRQVPKEYTESEEFTDLVSSKMLSMKAGPENMYLYIKDIVDELNMQRKLAKSQPVSQEPKTEEPTQLYGEKSNYDSKRERQIRKLEKTIKKLHRAIQKLEDQEVDFDDDDDSVYLLTERYKERMVRVYAKFCQLSNTKMPSEPRIILDARPGQPTGPAKKLEKWINKKVPIGTPLPFPDFHDVLRCVREANEEDKLGFNEADVMEEARDLFVRCGKKLQRRRQENEWRLAASRITVGADPAENNIELQKKLSENKKIAAQKENDIFNKFADRQNQLKLEGEEIGDKEAEESPVESEDEEEINNQIVSLENTERRKERLKRLIQEQCKKSNEEGVVQTSNENQNNKKTDLKIETCVQENNTIPEENVKEKEIVPENVTKSKADIIDNETAKTATVANKSESSKAKAKNLLSEKNDKKDDGNHNAEQSTNNDNCSQNTETFTLSDDSDELESDIDELHLLQRLHKSNADESSSVDTSDSDSPIAISDSLDSGEDNRKMIDDDVISIENSSYSEDELDSANTDNVQSSKEDTSCVDKEMISTDDNAMDVEFHSVKDIEVPSYATNDKDKNDIEDILLASTEEDNSGPADGVCFNLEDDLISIDETVVCAKKETNVTVVNPTSTNIYKQSGVCKQIETNTESNQISTDDLTINSIESNCKSSQETDIPVDNPITTKLDEGDEKCNQYEENAESNETPTDVLTINSVDSNCISPEETDIPVDNLNTTILDIDSDKCSQGEEYSQGNEIPTDDLTSNSIESNCELLEESSHKNGDVFVNDNALSGSNALDNQDVPGEDGDKYSQEENIKEIATDGLSIKFIESNCEVSEEISGKNCDVVFVEDHSNEFVENMDVDDDNNKMKILKDQEANVFTRRTEIS